MTRYNSITALAHQNSINNVIDFIELNIQDKIDLDKLADLANLSKYHFLRTFKSLIGETPIQFIIRLRLEKIASIMLNRPNESITNIATEFGFGDIASFSKYFKQHYGLNAKKWRTENSYLLQQESNILQTAKESLSYLYNNNIKYERKMVKYNSIEIKDIKQFSVAYIRHIGSYITKENIRDNMWSKLFAWAKPRGLLTNKDLNTLIVYHDDPNLTPADKQRTSFGIAIPENLKTDNKVSKMIIDSGKYLVAHFELAAHEFILAWDCVMNTIIRDGYEPDKRYCFEMYSECNKSGLYGLDIYFPIKI